jgi:hypothetical protein
MAKSGDRTQPSRCPKRCRSIRGNGSRCRARAGGDPTFHTLGPSRARHCYRACAGECPLRGKTDYCLRARCGLSFPTERRAVCQ